MALLALVPVGAFALFWFAGDGGPAGAPSSGPGSPPTPGAGGVANPRATLAPGGRGEILVNFTDRNATPAEGIRANVSGFSPPFLAADSSYQVGAEAVIGTDEAVFGIFTNTTREPTPFFSVFSNRTDRYLHLAYWPFLPVVSGAAYDFALVRSHGTVWELTVNGAPFAANATLASYDFGASSLSWLPGLGFSEIAIYASRSSVPAAQAVPLAFAVDRNGAWYLPTSAHAYFLGSPGSQWGVEGRTQHGTLAPGELESGRSFANLTNGTSLWTGGPVPVRVALGLSPTTAVAGDAISANVSVTASDGAPLAGVFVYIGDAFRATVSPATLPTDPTGHAATLLLAPNVSRASIDPVRATVTLFGYTGAGAASVFVRPATQLLIAITPASPSVVENGALGLTVQVRTGSGETPAGVLLVYNVSAPVGSGAGLSMGYGVTDGSGTTRVSLLAPPTPTSFRFSVTVSAGGFWGHATTSVRVVPGPAALWGALQPYVIVGAALAAAAAVAVLAFRRQRRRRRPIPAMGLRPVGQAARRARSRGPPPGPPPAPPPQP